MGQSTNGILVFGSDIGTDEDAIESMPWYEEDAEDGNGEDGFLTWFYKLHGHDVYAAWEKFPFDELRALPWDKKKEAEIQWEKDNPWFREGLDQKYEIEKQLKELIPIEIVDHCSCDYPLYIIGIKGYVHTAHRGYPETISTLEVLSEDLEKAQVFCEAYKIPFQNPQWFLASMWC